MRWPFRTHGGRGINRAALLCRRAVHTVRASMGTRGSQGTIPASEWSNWGSSLPSERCTGVEGWRAGHGTQSAQAGNEAVP
jgi:hypothetical protein